MQIRLQHLLVFLFGVLLKSLANVRARDVDQDVDLGQVRHGAEIRHVQLDGDSLQSASAQRLSFFLEHVGGARGQQRSSAGFGKLAGNGESDTAARAGDQRGFVCQRRHDSMRE